ncbi:MAG: hypothetical protein K2P74_01465 [Nitrosomonas sp.]|nr:hypothetical protein [Nitrosomonas sp.]
MNTYKTIVTFSLLTLYALPVTGAVPPLSSISLRTDHSNLEMLVLLLITFHLFTMVGM